jgi:hypothetical protein
MNLCGCLMHVEAIRIDPETGDPHATVPSEVYEQVDNIIRVCGDRSLTSVELPGRRGRWVLVVSPFCN